MKKHFLTVCAVVKNEIFYILEWIAFHKLVGVEHFYLYDNGSTDGTLQVFEGLQKKGVITLYDWKAVKPVQLKAYNDCLERHRSDSEWIAFIDVDEFLYSRAMPDLKECIRSMLFHISPRIGAIAARWFMFGANGHQEKGNELVIDRFTKRQGDYNLHVKSIVRADCTISTGKDPHSFYLNDNFFAVDDRGTILPRDYALTVNKGINNLRINHYHTKSYSEYFERKKLGDPQTMVVDTKERLEERFKAHDRNDVEDTFVKEKYLDFVKTMIIKELI